MVSAVGNILLEKGRLVYDSELFLRFLLLFDKVFAFSAFVAAHSLWFGCLDIVRVAFTRGCAYREGTGLLSVVYEGY